MIIDRKIWIKKNTTLRKKKDLSVLVAVMLFLCILSAELSYWSKKPATIHDAIETCESSSTDQTDHALRNQDILSGRIELAVSQLEAFSQNRLIGEMISRQRISRRPSGGRAAPLEHRICVPGLYVAGRSTETFYHAAFAADLYFYQLIRYIHCKDGKKKSSSII